MNMWISLVGMYVMGSILLRCGPPVFFMIPQLQIMCFYITRYYVKKMHEPPGGDKTYISTELGGGDRIDLFYDPPAHALFLHSNVLYNNT